MSSTLNQLKSQFGFHPCNYALFLKLKYLRKYYWVTLRQFHTWHRWVRKKTQNQHSSEPKYCQAFVAPKPWIKPVKGGFKLYPRTVVDHGVLELFESARQPSSEPVEPLTDETIKTIEALYEKVKTHFDGDY